MDTVTHVVLGAAVGEAVMGKQVGKHAMLWGALAANAPDIDAVFNFFVSDIDSLVMHRGITHSLFVGLLLGPLLGWLLWKAYRGKGTMLSWMVLITSNILLHDILDTCTVYGTGLLTPFHDYRYSWDTIFVADPLYTLPLVISGIVLLFLRNDNPSRYKWNRFGLITSSLYMGLAFYNHAGAANALENSLKEKGIEKQAFFAAPTLFNNFLWNLVALDEEGCWVGYYSVFDSDKTPELHYIPKNDVMLEAWYDDEEVKKLIIFTQGFYCVTQSEGKTLVNDLRFGQIGGWEDPKAPFAFAFDLSEDADNTMVVQKGRIEGSTRKMLRSMWNRIQGN